MEQKIRETDKIYDDKSHKIFYNVSAFSKATDNEIKGFLQFVKTGEAETDFARELMEAVDYVKLRESGSYHHYMMVRLHENDLRREGIQEGISIGEERGVSRGAHDKAVETARNLLALGVATPEQIAQATGLPLAEVQQMAKEVVSVPV